MSPTATFGVRYVLIFVLLLFLLFKGCCCYCSVAWKRTKLLAPGSISWVNVQRMCV
jgi:hypothetical protein